MRQVELEKLEGGQLSMETLSPTGIYLTAIVANRSPIAVQLALRKGSLRQKIDALYSLKPESKRRQKSLNLYPLSNKKKQQQTFVDKVVRERKLKN